MEIKRTICSSGKKKHLKCKIQSEFREPMNILYPKRKQRRIDFKNIFIKWEFMPKT